MSKTTSKSRYFATVMMADGTLYKLSTLLSKADSNMKLALSDAMGTEFVTMGLSLAPSTESGVRTSSGALINLCTHASAICRAICLVGTGQGRLAMGGPARRVRDSRIAKARLLLSDLATFKAQLFKEIARAEKSAAKQGKRLAVRLNVFSDVIWERRLPDLFTSFPNVQFYDYTKVPNRTPPGNYHLTFSRAEDNAEATMAHLAKGGNVAVVFEDYSFPQTWNGYPVIDGTAHDLRFLDPRGVVVALAEKNTDMAGPQYKGKRNLRVDTRGFVLPTITSNAYAQQLDRN